MPTFTIEIKGIALCYKREDIDKDWRVIFPFYDCFEPSNDCHKVKFSDAMGHIPVRPLAAPNTEITFDLEDAEDNFGEGNNFSKFINMTDSDLHKDGVKKKDGWEKRGVLLKIPDAEFAAGDLSRCRYQLLKADGSPARSPKTIGWAGLATIVAKSLTVKINGQPIGEPLTKDTRLIFNNHCSDDKPMTHPADVRMIYCIIEPKNAAQGPFAVERDPIQLPGPLQEKAHMTEEDTENGNEGDNKLFGIDEAENPPPQLAGLPCHLVISDPPPEGLP